MNVQISKKEMKGAIHLDVACSLYQNFKEADDSRQPIETKVKQEDLLPIEPIKLPEAESEIIDFNQESPFRGDHHRIAQCRNSRVGNETLSLQEFKENLGSFEQQFEDTLGNFWLILQSSSGIPQQ
jgi:hypothetical protein